ncbi:hypothetical protein HMPREF9005_1649 [Actinomyces sp. oral taxon 178 str. F0338]|nr:hypothetical protein HMPREF9005_1649 [Actinomyces sp. oral taxon 178 str. F0338]
MGAALPARAGLRRPAAHRAARPGLRHPSRPRPPEGPIPRGPVESERTDRRNWRDHACAGVHWNH